MLIPTKEPLRLTLGIPEKELLTLVIIGAMLLLDWLDWLDYSVICWGDGDCGGRCC
jgi:hypothetical protein